MLIKSLSKGGSPPLRPPHSRLCCFVMFVIALIQLWWGYKNIFQNHNIMHFLDMCFLFHTICTYYELYIIIYDWTVVKTESLQVTSLKVQTDLEKNLIIWMNIYLRGYSLVQLPECEKLHFKWHISSLTWYISKF